MTKDAQVKASYYGIKPQEMRYNTLKDIVHGTLSTAQDKEAASFELTVRNIQQSSVSDGLLQVKNLMESAKRGVAIERTLSIIEEAYWRETRKGDSGRQSLLTKLHTAIVTLADMINSEDAKQAGKKKKLRFDQLKIGEYFYVDGSKVLYKKLSDSETEDNVFAPKGDRTGIVTGLYYPYEEVYVRDPE